MYQDILPTQSRLAVYRALYELRSCIDNLGQVNTLTEDPMREYGPGGPNLTNILYKHWKKPYVGTSCDFPQNTARGYEESYTRDHYYLCCAK